MTLGISGIQSRIAAIQSQFARPAGSFPVAPSGPDATAEFTVAGAGSAGFAGGVVDPAGSASGVATSAGTGGLAAGWAQQLPAAAQPWIGAIEDAAAKHGVDPRLLASLVKHESGFRAEARSHAGAVGLTQLMPATARGLGVDPHDPLQNLDGGARYLRSMLDRFGRTELALAAYNAGPGRVAQAGGVPQIAETQRYVTAVMSSYRQLR